MKRYASILVAFTLGTGLGWITRHPITASETPLVRQYRLKAQDAERKYALTGNHAELFRKTLALVQAQETASMERNRNGEDERRWEVSDELERCLVELENHSQTEQELAQAAWLRRRAHGPTVQAELH